jgi:hypothetical protein
MCKAWTQEDYRKDDYTDEVIEYQDSEGKLAITVVDIVGDHTNVYSEDGKFYEHFWFGGDGIKVQRNRAAKAMAKKGFTLRVIPQEVTAVAVATAVVQPIFAGNGSVVESSNITQPLTEVAPVVVQGRTIAQWHEEGRLNEGRALDDHVHPAPPADGEVATNDTIEAFAASCTVDETSLILLQQLYAITS